MTETRSAGTRIYVGDAPIDDKDLDFVQSDFDSVTWLEIGGILSIDPVIEQAETIDVTHLAYPRRKTIKGVRGAPTLSIVASLRHSNAGQAKMIEAEASQHNYPFRLVYDDAPATGTAPTPSERMFIGLVMSAGDQLDDVNNFIRLNASIEPNSNLVRINAATGD